MGEASVLEGPRTLGTLIGTACQDRYPSSVGLLQQSWIVTTWIALYEDIT